MCDRTRTKNYRLSDRRRTVQIRARCSPGRGAEEPSRVVTGEKHFSNFHFSTLKSILDGTGNTTQKLIVRTTEYLLLRRAFENVEPTRCLCVVVWIFTLYVHWISLLCALCCFHVVGMYLLCGATVCARACVCIKTNNCTNVGILSEEVEERNAEFFEKIRKNLTCCK